MNRMSSKFWQLNANNANTFFVVFQLQKQKLDFRVENLHQITSNNLRSLTIKRWVAIYSVIVLHCNGPSVHDYLYFHPLHFDSPRPGGFVNDFLHKMADHLSLGENFCQSLPCRKWALGYNWQHQYICIVKAPNILHEPSQVTLVPRTFLKLVATKRLVECM